MLWKAYFSYNFPKILTKNVKNANISKKGIIFIKWSRDENRYIKMCSILALVGVDTKMKFLSRRVNEIIGK